MEINDNSAKYILINGSMYDSGESVNDVLKNNGFFADENTTVIYEVIRIIDGMPLFLEDHYKRLLKSAGMVGAFNIISQAAVFEYTRMMLKINNLNNCNIKIMCLLKPGSEETSFAMYHSKAFYPPQQAYDEGVVVDCLEIMRDRPNAKIRNENYIAAIERFKNTSGVPLFEVLLVNGDGAVTEGSKSNVFFVKDKTVITAPDDVVLKGVMRMHVLDICEEYGIGLEMRSVQQTEISEMSGAFLTGTSIKVLPIAAIGAVELNSSANHIVEKIMRALDEEIAEDTKAQL